MLHARYAICAALTLLFACNDALAEQDGPPTCSGHVNGQWQPLEGDSMMSCFRRVDESVTEYNAQGFKFGLWGRTLLSADRYYFYSSADGGKNWQAVGLKTELTRSTENVPPPPAPTGANTSVETANESAATAETTSPAQTPAAGEAAQNAPADTATETASVAPAASAPAPVVAERSAAQTLPAADRRNCSIHAGSNWELIARLTLEECAQELDKSADRYDANGFKYAYWSGVFLAANATEVLKSSDSHKWDLVLMRAER
ncbi:MAG: hypothetical protein WC809_19410 [Sinimarinibacterium sp.]|jgi:hypothetical protein